MAAHIQWTPEQLAAIADRVERGETLTSEEKLVTSGALRILAADLWKASLSTLGIPIEIGLPR